MPRKRPRPSSSPAEGPILGDFPSAKAWGQRLRLSGSAAGVPPAPLYSVAFCGVCEALENVFASVGGNRISVYQLSENADGIELLQLFVDEDTAEDFYSCDWTSGPNGEPWLCAGGQNSHIKVLNCGRGGDEAAHQPSVARVLQGHTNQVLCLAAHPLEPALLLSASKDESARLWNVHSGSCVAIFAGHEGHRQQVLSCAWHPEGRSLVTAAMDQYIKIWSLDTLEVQRAIVEARTWDPEEKGRQFPTLHEQFPQFSTRHVHTDYVDCVRFLGNLLMSKSIENTIVFWNPTPSKARKDAVTVLREYTFQDANFWYVKFDLDVQNGRLAVGNRMGSVFIWNLYAAPELNLIEEEAAKDEDVRDGLGSEEQQQSGHGKQDSRTPSPTESSLTEETDAADEQSAIQVFEADKYRFLVPPHHKVSRTGRAIVRDVAFSPDGNNLVFCCEDGTVWRFATNEAFSESRQSSSSH